MFVQSKTGLTYCSNRYYRYLYKENSTICNILEYTGTFYDKVCVFSMVRSCTGVGGHFCTLSDLMFFINMKKWAN